MDSMSTISWRHRGIYGLHESTQTWQYNPKQNKPQQNVFRPWWRHKMEIFSALLAICAGNSPVTGEFPAQRPVTRGFDVFYHLCLNKRLSKQSWGWWFETPSRPSLWWSYKTLLFLSANITGSIISSTILEPPPANGSDSAVSEETILKYCGRNDCPSNSLNETQIAPPEKDVVSLEEPRDLVGHFEKGRQNLEYHDDVIKWKHFPRYWPFVREIHRWIPLTKASDAELWCFFDLCLNKRWSKPSKRWWFESLSCSLWRHCNGTRNHWYSRKHRQICQGFSHTPGDDPESSCAIRYASNRLVYQSATR